MKLSLQLYSVRDEIKTHGLKEVLTTVKNSGFDAVETAGYYDLGAAGLKKLLDEVGLSVTSAHVSYKDISEDAERVIGDVRALGISDAIIAWVGPDVFENGYDWLIANIARAQEIFAANGMRLAYHNHEHETEKEDYLKKMTDAVDGLMLEPDIFWLAFTGGKPAEYIKRFKNKLMTLHLKELLSEGVRKPNPVLGQGISQTEECVKFAREINLPYVVLEYEGLDMPYADYLKACADFIRKNT